MPENFIFTLRDRAGVTRWPAVPVEMGFLALMLALILFWKGRGMFRDRLFFIFLAAYGLFRFAHEWMRDTPKWFGLFSGYQVIALAMAALGVVMFKRRGSAQNAGLLA